MSPTYKTPGVYVPEVNAFPPSIVSVNTGIPIFIGYTQKAEIKGESLRGRPYRISSLTEYEASFGKAYPERGLRIVIKDSVAGRKPLSISVYTIPDTSPYLMYYSIQLFFANGGGTCYVLSVGDFSKRQIVQREIVDSLVSALREDEPDLVVIPDAINLPSADEYYSLQQELLEQCIKAGDKFSIMDTYGRTAGYDAELRNKLMASVSQLRNGAVYYPWLKTVIPYELDPHYTSVYWLVLEGGRWRTKLKTRLSDHLIIKDPGIYYKIKLELTRLTVTLPPSGMMAGVYARTDRERGVWKAPANVRVNGVIEPEVKIDNAEQQDMNAHSSGKSINAIRNFIGQGTLVWGARTLAGNDNEWRYISVRRFYGMVEESVKKGVSAYVFEPNDANTWLKVKAMIENYLMQLWHKGALAGAKTEQAYFVKVGLGTSMTAQDILEGKLMVEMGIAIIRPAEFIVLRISQKMQES